MAALLYLFLHPISRLIHLKWGVLQEPHKGAYISTTSFYPAKVLGAAGDGGAVFTNNSKLAYKVRELANHGRASHYGHSSIGWNSRLDSIQAAFLNLSLEYLPQRLASRRSSASFYYKNLSTLNVKQMQPPAQFRENGYCNVCLFDDASVKKRIESALSKASIGFGNIYPSTISEQPGASGFLHAHVGGNNAHKLCTSVLNLPLFAYITEVEMKEAIDILAKNLID